MAECQHLKTEPVTIVSKEIHPDRFKRTTETERIWCDHPKHSPRRKGTFGFTLKCEGALSGCHLTEDQFNDVNQEA